MCTTLHHLTFWPQDDLWPDHNHHSRTDITQELFVQGLNKIDQEIKKWEQVEQKTLTFLPKNDAHGHISLDLLTSRWPLTSPSSSPYNWYYPRIICSKFEQNWSRNKEMRASRTKNFNIFAKKWCAWPHITWPFDPKMTFDLTILITLQLVLVKDHLIQLWT